jgi:molybdate transport system substrate-binding protein
VLLPLSAEAADITVFAPGITTAGLRKLANAWMIETGNRVNLVGGTVGAVKNDVTSGMPGDIVMVPAQELKDKQIAAKLKPGTTEPVGRILFGLIVKAGAPHPDISTVKKFAAALKAASGVGFNDPASQSLGGQMVYAMLMRPEFKGVNGVPLKQGAAGGVADGTVPMAAGTRSEQLGNPNIELVGLFPEALKMHIDMSAAVLADSKAPEAAQQFAHYIARAEAAAAWNDCGVVAPRLKAKSAMGRVLRAAADDGAAAICRGGARAASAARTRHSDRTSDRGRADRHRDLPADELQSDRAGRRCGWRTHHDDLG